MHALVIFESMFGNTRTVAEAVGEVIAERMEVDVVEVGFAPRTIAPEIDLLVIGGPTHAHGMTKPESRKQAAGTAKRPLVSAQIGIREWLERAALPSGIAAAAFDTRIRGPRLLWGSAARGIEPELQRLGARMLVPPEDFLVSGPTGPVHDILLPGELDRARRWAERLARLIGARQAASAG